MYSGRWLAAALTARWGCCSLHHPTDGLGMSPRLWGIGVGVLGVLVMDHGIRKFGTWEGPKVAPWKTCTWFVLLWHSLFFASVLFWYAHLHFKSLFWGRMKRIWSYPSCRITINGYRSWLFEAMRCFVFTGRTRRFGWWTSKWHWSRLLLEKQKMAFGMWLILIAGHPGLQLKRL